jgi:hypothetical protein
VHALSKYVVEEAVKIVKMSVKEIVIENQVQPSRIKLNKEKIAIKGKTGARICFIIPTFGYQRFPNTNS